MERNYFLSLNNYTGAETTISEENFLFLAILVWNMYNV